MSDHDPEYILFTEGDPRSVGAGLRRALAMHQWSAVRSDREFKSAATRCSETRHIPNDVPDAWRAFWRGNADRIVRTVRVASGEPITHQPLMAPLDWTSVQDAIADGDPGGRLLTALIQLDTDALIQTVALHDPFSWHCMGRGALQMISVPEAGARCERAATVPRREGSDQDRGAATC